MKRADMAVGMEVMLGAPSLASYSIKRAVILGFGWQENRFGHFRAVSDHAAKFYPGGKGVAVAVLGYTWREYGVESWYPDVVQASQIRGPWAPMKAAMDAQDDAAKQARLAEVTRREEIEAETDVLIARAAAVLGPDLGFGVDHRSRQATISFDDLRSLCDRTEALRAETTLFQRLASSH